MFRFKSSALTMLFVMVGGLAVAWAGSLGCQRANQEAKIEQKAETKTDDKPAKAKEWEFPEAEQHRTSMAAEVYVADYATAKPFEEVWAHYAKKIGYQEGYKPNMSYGGYFFGGPGGGYGIQILNSTSEPTSARVRRATVKSATLLRHGGGGNVTIILSRGKDEDKTYITLIVEGK